MLTQFLIRFLARTFKVSNNGPSLTRFYILPHIKLHYIHTSDIGFHTHPWNAISIIFGSYSEEFLDGTKHTRIGLNYLPAERSHKISIHRPVWTLLINGRRTNEQWQYGGEVKPWRGPDKKKKHKLKNPK